MEVKSDREGYLVIFHRDADGRISLVFPNKKDRATKVTKGEIKIVRGKITPPFGKKCFTGIITEEKLVDENIVNKSESEQIKEIEKFIEKLKKCKFIKRVYEYEVKPPGNQNKL